MSPDRLEESLRLLGIDPERIGLVGLLPLVQVAWADGQIQERERALILEVAQRHDLFDPSDQAVIGIWLADEPSPFFQDTARRVLIELTQKTDLPGGLDRSAVVAWCWAIAATAGGLLGSRLFAITSEERNMLNEIAEALGVDEVPDYVSLLDAAGPSASGDEAMPGQD